MGVAGLTLGGGLGILGRMYGVSDHLVGAEVVLADGRLLHCDDHHHQDLFWALRGAPAPAISAWWRRSSSGPCPPPTTINVHLAWPYARAAAVIGARQRWAPTGPDELAASLKITAGDDPHRPPAVDVYAAFHGSRAGAAELVEELAGGVGSDPTAAVLTPMTWPQTRKFWAELGDPGEASIPGQPRRCACMPGRSSSPAPPGSGRRRAPWRPSSRDEHQESASWTSCRGRRLQPPATRRHRLRPPRPALPAQARRGGGPRRPPTDQAAAHRAATRSWASVHPWGSGRVFQNFADPDLEHWAEAYYGPNYPPVGPGQGALRPLESVPVPAVVTPAPLGHPAARLAVTAVR